MRKGCRRKDKKKGDQRGEGNVFTPGGMKTLFPIFENSWFAKQELAGVDVVVALLVVLL